MIKVHLDFETRSDVDLPAVGAYKYSLHLNTVILCLSFAVGKEPPILIRFEEDGHYPLGVEDHANLRRLYELARSDKTVFAAHNAMFEFCIWNHILVDRVDAPRLPINRWRCTLAKAASCALPLGLDGCAKALNLKNRKYDLGQRSMKRLSNASNSIKQVDLELLWQYNLQDVEVERELDHRLPDLSHEEQKLWELDLEINLRGVRFDRRLAEIAVEEAEKLNVKMANRAKIITGGFIDSTNQVVSMAKWLKEQGVELPNIQKETIAGVLKQPNLPPLAAELLKIRQLTSSASIKKYNTMLNMMSDLDDRIRGMFQYWGAFTGRWAGRGVQLQNLPKGILDPILCADLLLDNDPSWYSLFGSLPNILVSSIRAAIIPSEGHKFYVGDQSAIEARVVVWLARQMDALEAYTNNEDNYILMASAIFGKTPQDITKPERQFGKMSVLGCGFQMGPPRFAAANNCDEEMAQRCVMSYREKNYNVVAFWNLINSAAINAVKNPFQKFSANMVSFEYRGEFLICTLPSGRTIRYYQPKVETLPMPWHTEENPAYGENLTYMTLDSVKKVWCRTKTFGGKLTENVVQAIARDIIAANLIALDAAGFRVVMHVHDEIIAEVPENDDRLPVFQHIMETPPAWVPPDKPIPLASEVFETARYCK